MINQGEKARLREVFKNAQKLYDKKYRLFKRKHNSQKINELKDAAENNPNEMWKKN